MILARLRWQIGELHSSLFAYQANRSTTTCLMTLLDTLRFRSGLVVFLDLEKAFELANPQVILELLATKGVCGKLLQWLQDFLTDRSARVRFQGRLSTSYSHALGTPQGSCLSPFLFNILMEGLVSAEYGSGVQLLCYANDLALVFPGQCQPLLISKALNNLQRRCTSLGLKLNAEKSWYMTFRQRPPRDQLKLGQTNIKYTTTHQYLGIWLDTKLTFSTHVRYIQERIKARTKALLFISRGGKGAPTKITRLFYIAAIRSIIDYCAPCLPGLSDALIKSLEVLQNDALRAILNAPRWTRIVTMRKECGLPSIRHRIYARAATSTAKFLKTKPNSSLAAHLRRGLQHQHGNLPGGNWIHNMVDAARTLEVSDLVCCEPDLPIPDFLPAPPWAPKTFKIIFPSSACPRQQLPALLRQESLATIASMSAQHTSIYFTDGSLGPDGRCGSAFVCGETERSLRLPDDSSAFQAELVALLYALQHALVSPYKSIRIFTDSLSALHSIKTPTSKDNVQLLSSIHQHLQALYRQNTDVCFHWVPGHVGVSGNERADAAARRGSTGPVVTFSLPPSYKQIKSKVNRAAWNASGGLLQDAVAEGSRSATWYVTATRECPRIHPCPFPPPVTRHLVRLRLGFLCSSQILGGDPARCAHCLEEPQEPLVHYILECPASHSLRRLIPAIPEPDYVKAAHVIASAPLPLLADLVSMYPPPR